MGLKCRTFTRDYPEQRRVCEFEIVHIAEGKLKRFMTLILVTVSILYKL